MDRETQLRKLAGQAVGLRYDSPEAQKILDTTDWQDYWPVVDGDGTLTGEIVGDEEGYANVDDAAMVSLDDLSPAQRQETENGQWDGYITL